jgi:hypothetical protein
VISLDENNFILYCAKAYQNPHCLDINEFNQDVARIRSFGKILARYSNGKTINIRATLNQLILLFNIFEAHSLVTILVYKNYQNLDKLVPMLNYLGYIKQDHTEGPFGPDQLYVSLNTIDYDQYIADELAIL